MDDCSGHDYASDDEPLSIAAVLRHFNVILHATYLVYIQMLVKGESYNMKKIIALDLLIAMFIFHTISCDYVRGSYN